MTDQELIERVAVEVMGWEPILNDGRMWMQNSKVVYWRKPWPNSGDDQWNPLEHIDYMDMVLERMRERGLYLDVGMHINHTEWWAVFTGDTIGKADGTDITAMFRAILLAALDAVAHG